MMTAPKNILFVYGSLKRGFSNQHWLAGQTYLGKATTTPLYRMFDYGGFPALIPAESIDMPGRSITGELWQVDATTLDRLDILEGVDHGLYRRAEIRLQRCGSTPGDAVTSATGYLYLRDVAGLPDVGCTWTVAMDRQ